MFYLSFKRKNSSKSKNQNEENGNQIQYEEISSGFEGASTLYFSLTPGSKIYEIFQWIMRNNEC